MPPGAVEIKLDEVPGINEDRADFVDAVRIDRRPSQRQSSYDPRGYMIDKGKDGVEWWNSMCDNSSGGSTTLVSWTEFKDPRPIPTRL